MCFKKNPIQQHGVCTRIGRVVRSARNIWQALDQLLSQWELIWWPVTTSRFPYDQLATLREDDALTMAPGLVITMPGLFEGYEHDVSGYKDGQVTSGK